MSAKRPKSAFTIVQNEPVWLDYWAAYYARQVAVRLTAPGAPGAVAAALARAPDDYLRVWGEGRRRWLRLLRD